MKVNFVTEMTRFYRFDKTHQLSNNAQLLWYKLFLTWNEAGFPDWLQIDTKRLMVMAGVNSRKVLCRARDELIEAGLLKKERLSHKVPNRYQFILFGKQSNISRQEDHLWGHPREDESGDSKKRKNADQKEAPNEALDGFMMGRKEPFGDHLFDQLGGQAECQWGAGVNRAQGYQKESIYKQEETKAENKKAYGQFKSVWLTDQEFEKLQTDFPDDYEEWIKRLDLGKAMKGYSYDNDYAAILSWYENDRKKEQEKAFQELMDQEDIWLNINQLY